MEAFEAIRTLLAVRRYLDRPVPEAIVRKIVEAGRLTGSAMNLQPWQFIVVQDRETLRRLGALARSGPYVAEAPLAIVVAVEKTGYAVSDASRAIHSMLLVAWSEGVGSNWVGFGGLEKVNALLGIPGRARRAGDPAVRLSCRPDRAGQEEAEAPAGHRPSRALWPALRVVTDARSNGTR